MFRYIAYYKYTITTPTDDNEIFLTNREISEINDIFMTDTNMNPMMNELFHECISDGTWKTVPIELDKKVKGWNWKLKDNEKGYVEILSEEPLTQEELNIMAKETEGQISDGYNESPFEFKLSNGKEYWISFETTPQKEFMEL